MKYAGREKTVLTRAEDEFLELRRQVEQEFVLSQQRFHEALQSSRQVIYRYNTRSSRFDYVSPSAEEVTGYTAEELTAWDALEVVKAIHPEDWARISTELAKARLACHEAKLNLSLEYRWLKKGGDYRWLNDWATFVFDSSGNVEAVMGAAYDVTGQREVQEALRRSEQRLGLALSGADLALWDLDLTRGEAVVSSRWPEMLGHEPRETIVSSGRWVDTIHPDDLYRVLEELGKHLYGEASFYESEYRLRTKSGEWIWVRDRGRVVEWDSDGYPLRAAGTHLDITEHKRAEEEGRLRQQQLVQADKLSSLGVLVSGVAHEINNPNHFIMSHAAPLRRIWEGAIPILDRYYHGNGDFMIGGKKYSQMRSRVPEMVANILEGCERIRDIVGELRAYARDLPDELAENIQINNVVRSALTLTDNMIRKSTRFFTVEYGEQIPPFTGNYQRIEQVIINLVQNACQALDSRDHAVRVSTVYDAAASEIHVDVKDEGGGIPPEHLNRVTDPFFTTKRDKGGTGLGLSISSSIVREHGGVLRFLSEPGKGTRVTMVLPVKGL